MPGCGVYVVPISSMLSPSLANNITFKMLYVCDCQFSIAYGRPPVTIEDATIKNYEKFLEGPKVVNVPGDIRLSAQVALFRVLTEAYQKFGTDMDQILEDEDFTYLRRFNVAVEEWRLSWEKRSGK